MEIDVAILRERLDYNPETGELTWRHRVAWAIYYGAWPERLIDHENGKRADNRIVNLRQADDQQNMRNVGMQKNNTTGVMGVCWCKQTNSWRAMIRVDYKTKCLGRYKRLDDAIVARKLAEKKYGFHENHGTCVRPIQNSWA